MFMYAVAVPVYLYMRDYIFERFYVEALCITLGVHESVHFSVCVMQVLNVVCISVLVYICEAESVYMRSNSPFVS